MLIFSFKEHSLYVLRRYILFINIIGLFNFILFKFRNSSVLFILLLLIRDLFFILFVSAKIINLKISLIIFIFINLLRYYLLIIF